MLDNEDLGKEFYAKLLLRAKYARIHKRLMEKGDLTDSETKLFDALMGLKETADNQLLQNAPAGQ